MTVDLVMTKNPAFIHPDASLNDAKALMSKLHIGKLPVLDARNRLVGLVTKKDLLGAGPSAATTLDMYEISYLLSKITVEKIMVKQVRTVQSEEVVEEAARIMADNGIGCLPVMDGPALAGIITESDLFHAFIGMFGAREPGVRVTFLAEEKPGILAEVTHALSGLNANIVALVTYPGDNISNKRCTIKADGISRVQMRSALEQSGVVIEDVR
jgi:acetoin utilization protein AcuB